MKLHRKKNSGGKLHLKRKLPEWSAQLKKKLPQARLFLFFLFVIFGVVGVNTYFNETSTEAGGGSVESNVQNSFFHGFVDFFAALTSPFGDLLTGAAIGISTNSSNSTNSSFIADIHFSTSKTMYKVNETIELKGRLYLSNLSANGSLVVNHTALPNATINITIINKNNSAVNFSVLLNTTGSGAYYTKSDYYPNATDVHAPLSGGDYYILVNYTDLNGTGWWTKNEVTVVNQTVDKIQLSTDKLSYNPSESLILTVETIRLVGDDITYTPNVTLNGSIRNSTKDILSTFTCTTGDTGKCTISTTAPSSYGEYWVEANGFKGFSLFEVEHFKVNIWMKDELGKGIKHSFDTNKVASVEVNVITNSSSETYTFDGIIKNSVGSVVKSISSTILNSTNSYTNRFTFTLDALNFTTGNYYVDVNVTKSGDGIVGTSTSFEVQTWNLVVKKRESGSGFDHGYSVFPSTVVYLEAYPKGTNGSILSGINSSGVNTTSSINISLTDTMGNTVTTVNASWNASCGKEGCYEFSLTTPALAGNYLVQVAVSYGNSQQTATKVLNVISASLSSQPTDKDGTLKELFGTNEFVYLTLSAKNTTSNFNLSNARVTSVMYMNGSELNYTNVANFELVNSSTTALEWAWNSSQQRLKLDVPKAGGVYAVNLMAENDTTGTSARFLVNPYDVCLVAKNTAGSVTSGYYYVYQFKITDTIYFELKLSQANNPTGRAPVDNGTNSSYGMGMACSLDTTQKSAVTNATITIDEVKNTLTGKSFSLNTTDSVCKADDNSGSYTCTVKSLTSWDGGSYAVKFKVTGQDGQTSDIAYGMFEARAFYLYAWSTNYQNRPNSNIALTVSMYEAGNNWWGGMGSGGLGGTVELKKIEYQGSDGEWLWPPIEYTYNTSLVNKSTITGGRGTLTLPVNFTSNGVWKSGYYRAVLQGTDSAGNSDYGYAWFGVRRWEMWGSPVECSGSSCTSVWNINSKKNISLYVTINNAGQYGQSGNDLGGDVVVRVKKINDCRKWPCTELNSSLYTATTINVSKSSGWYWGTVNTSYLIYINYTGAGWGTGYWQVTLDANNSETGSGWFNTIAFYVETQPTDVNGTNWKYNIKNNQPMYYKVTSVRSQKSGYYYSSYNASDYLNTTVTAAVLRTWNQNTWQSIEYRYPTHFNISPMVINGSTIVNLTYNNGSWPSGYYWGELTLNNSEGESANGWLWFNVQPFRVQVSSNQYTIDSDVCVNGTINIYDPDWYSNTVLAGNYTISSVYERVWSNYGSSLVTFTNFTPSATFNGTATLPVCPNNGSWGSGSWGGYHSLSIKVSNNESASQEGWLSFRAVPFQVSWGSISGGTNKQFTVNVSVPVTLSKASGNATGNLSTIYQWRYDNWMSRQEQYNFTVGSCSGGLGVGSCRINGTATVNIIAPSGGWKEGYNYLYATWTESTNANSKVEDWNGIWFNGVGAYNGWFNNQDTSGNWKYYFGFGENLTINLNVYDASNQAATVNITQVQYSTPSTTCWDDYCRTYNTANWNMISGNTSSSNISGSGIIKIIKPSGNWSKGYIYIKVTVSGSAGTATIKNGNVMVKDMTAPVVNLTIPGTGQNITASTFFVNWTTTENAQCWLQLLNFGNFNSWYCSYSWYNISTQPYCNNAVYSGNTYYYDYVGRDYRSWNVDNTWGWSSGATGLSTGGTSHYYQFTTPLINQSYGIQVYCNDEDWNSAYGWVAINTNYTVGGTTTTASSPLNVTLSSPANAGTVNSSIVLYNYSFIGPANGVNCSLYSNVTGNWSINYTMTQLNNNTAYSFNNTPTNGTYLWNVYCVQSSNSSNSDWGDQNRTFTFAYVPATTTTIAMVNVTLLSPANGSTVNSTPILYNFSFSGQNANCSLYGNFTGNWNINYTLNNRYNSTEYSFNNTLSNGTYLWNVYCVKTDNSSNFDWGNHNWTFTKGS